MRQVMEKIIDPLNNKQVKTRELIRELKNEDAKQQNSIDDLEVIIHNKPTSNDPDRKTKFDEYDEKLFEFQKDLTLQRDYATNTFKTLVL